MIKKLTAAAIALSMMLSFAVMPAHAASFSAANKRHNAYDLAKSSDSNFTSLASDYGGEYLQANTITFDYDHTNENVDSTFSGVFYTKNRAKFKGTTTSSKDGLIKYKWTNGIMGRAADGSKVAADIPVFVHQRIYFAWYAGRGESLEFRPYYNTSEGSTTGFKLFKEDGGYIQNMNSKSAFSMVKYNESGFDLTTSSSTSNPVFNTFDFIFDYSNGHEFAWFFFINGKLVGISKPTSNKPDMFYGWTLRSPDTINRQNDYVTIYGDEANGWGHTEYIQANGYYPTLEDVMQDKGLMTESVSDSKIMMKTTDLAGYMPPASANAKVNNVQINEDVSYSGTAATISHTQSNTDEEEIAAHMLQGVIPPDKSGVSYASYHPRAKYVKISFDQTIGAGTIAYKLCYNTNRTAALSFWKDNGYLYASVKGGGGNNYLNGAGGRTTAGENATNHIDWILEFHENEQDTSEGGIIHYLYCNGDFVAQGKVGNHSNTRLADITVETKGSSSPEVTIDNWSMTLYNQEAVFNDIGMGSPSQGEIPAPKHENVKVIFTENFEGKTAESLASTYPRTTRISDGTCLSYWGNWGSALATGYNSVNGIFACAGVASNNSRTCEIYVPADKRPQRGLANIKFNIKPQASLSRQNVILFRTDSYAASDDGKNGVQILENGDLTPYTGSWLEVNVWVDLDNDTYLYNVYNTGNGNVVKRGSGTQKFNNLGGFVIKLKGSDSGKDFSEVAPVIDNIYFASAEIPDNNAFNLKTFSFADGDADINLAVGDNVTEYTDVYMMLYSGTDNRLKNVVKQPVTFNSNTKRRRFPLMTQMPHLETYTGCLYGIKIR